MSRPLAEIFVVMLSVLVLLGWTIPGVRVLKKMGFSGWCVIIGLIPGLNLIGLWVLAYTRWPAVDGVSPPASRP